MRLSVNRLVTGLFVLTLTVGGWAGGAPARAQSAPAVADYFVDQAGKPYLLLDDARLVTANPLGRNRFEFFDSSLGGPTTVDVSDPFAILLFYPDYGTVVTLDRTLSEIARTDLFALDDVLEPSAVAGASDRGLWVYDAWDYRLKLLDPNGRTRLATNDLRLELDLTDAPVAVYVDRGRVLLHYAGRLAVFTNFGRFERWVELPAADRFAWSAPFLTGTGPAGFWTYRTGEIRARPQVQGRVGLKATVAGGVTYQLNEAQQLEVLSPASPERR